MSNSQGPSGSQSGGEEPKGKAGRPAKIKAEHGELLRALVAQRPASSLDELCVAFAQQTGVQVCGATLRTALREAGIVRVLPQQRETPVVTEARVEAQANRPPRYGYTEAHRAVGDSARYPICLTDAEWVLAADLFEARERGRGTPPSYPRRLMLDACCYVLRTGCAWRQLPKDFPPWEVVYKTFSRWAAKGKFETLHDRLRAQWRARIERAPGPTAAVLDAQSTRGSPQGGGTGFDAGKKVKGRKRNLVVDTLGLVLAVVVTAANVQDRDGAPPVVAAACTKYPSLKKLYVDGAYGGLCAQGLQRDHGITVEVVRHPGNRTVGRWHDTQLALFEPVPANTFIVLPKRWVVERTHAWNERARRLIMHHDRNPEISTHWVWLAEARILSRRLISAVV